MRKPQADDERPSSPRRISVAAARKMLGMVGRNYCDEDLTEIVDLLYGLAEESFETYREVGTDGKQNDTRIGDSDE